MDPLDLAIYRALSPGGEARFWAGRRIIDPEISARAIAEQVGVSENGVRARLQGLTRQGFLRGRAVVPNPSLFGMKVFVGGFPIREAGDVDRIYRDLALVEGVTFARDLMDEGTRQVRVYFVSENETTAARRAALLRRLSPAGQFEAPQPVLDPPVRAGADSARLEGPGRRDSCAGGDAVPGRADGPGQRQDLRSAMAPAPRCESVLVDPRLGGGGIAPGAHPS